MRPSRISRLALPAIAAFAVSIPAAAQQPTQAQRAQPSSDSLAVEVDSTAPHHNWVMNVLRKVTFRGDGPSASDSTSSSATTVAAPAPKARPVFDSRADRREYFVNLARLHGLIALAEGKTDSAVADFHLGDNEADGLPTQKCVPCTPLFLGLAFDRAGKADSARTYLTRYVEMHASGRWNVDSFTSARRCSG